MDSFRILSPRRMTTRTRTERRGRKIRRTRTRRTTRRMRRRKETRRKRRRMRRRNRKQTRTTNANKNKSISFLEVDGFVISFQFWVIFSVLSQCVIISHKLELDVNSKKCDRA